MPLSSEEFGNGVKKDELKSVVRSLLKDNREYAYTILELRDGIFGNYSPEDDSGEPARIPAQIVALNEILQDLAGKEKIEKRTIKSDNGYIAYYKWRT